MASKIEGASRTNAYNIDPTDLTLVTDKAHPLYDPRVTMPLDEAMVRSIMFQGVIEPVVITRDGDTCLVVDGRQRVRAAVEANKRLEKEGKETIKVTCVLRRGNESDLFGVAISANENRQDDTPLGRATKCQRYMNMGRSEAEAAVTFGVTTQCIRQWMKVLECSATVRKAVEEGKIAASAAAQLADLAAEDQESALAGALADCETPGSNGKTARPTARKVAKAAGKAAAKMRSRREILARLEETRLPRDYRAALLWVLGSEE
jgi:ParB family chromosome partitioning protein